MNPLSVSERLSQNRYTPDEVSHIVINQDVARASGAAEILTRVCPAGVYRKEADGTISAAYAACLECGTCLAVAPPGSLEWHYPAGGRGVQYREG